MPPVTICNSKSFLPNALSTYVSCRESRDRVCCFMDSVRGPITDGENETRQSWSGTDGSGQSLRFTLRSTRSAPSSRWNVSLPAASRTAADSWGPDSPVRRARLNPVSPGSHPAQGAASAWLGGAAGDPFASSRVSGRPTPARRVVGKKFSQAKFPSWQNRRLTDSADPHAR